MPSNESQFLRTLEIEVTEELVTVQANHPDEAVGVATAECFLDPTDIEREEIGLRSLLGAVKALAYDSEPNQSPDV